MVCAKDNAMTVTQFDSHMMAVCAVQFSWLTSDKVLDGCGSTQICQSVLEDFSHFRAQLSLSLRLTLTDGAK